MISRLGDGLLNWLNPRHISFILAFICTTRESCSYASMMAHASFFSFFSSDILGYNKLPFILFRKFKDKIVCYILLIAKMI